MRDTIQAAVQASLEDLAARRLQLEREAVAAVLRTAERTPDPGVRRVLSGFSDPSDDTELGPPPPYDALPTTAAH